MSQYSGFYHCDLGRMRSKGLLWRRPMSSFGVVVWPKLGQFQDFALPQMAMLWIFTAQLQIKFIYRISSFGSESQSWFAVLTCFCCSVFIVGLWLRSLYINLFLVQVEEHDSICCSLLIIETWAFYRNIIQ